MFIIIIPVIVPYFISLNLSMKEIFKLQAIFGLMVAICEVPSGYLSDLWGRKKTLVLGSFFTGLGFTSLLWAKSFGALVIYEMILAFSLSLISGTDISILYDSLDKTEKNKDSEIEAMANIEFSKLSAESIAAILGGLIVSISFEAVVIAQAIVGWLPFMIALTLVEPERIKMNKDEHLINFKRVLHFIFFEDKIIRLVFMNSIIWGLSTFFVVWMFQKYWLVQDISLTHFGFLWAGYNITVGLVGKVVPSLEKKHGPISLLVMIGICSVLGYFGMGLFAGGLGIIAGLLFQVSRGINSVLLGDALNGRTPSEFRATMNSMKSLFFRLGFFIIGPILGTSVDERGMDMTLITLGWVYLVFFIICLIPLIIEVRKIKTWEKV